MEGCSSAETYMLSRSSSSSELVGAGFVESAEVSNALFNDNSSFAESSFSAPWPRCEDEADVKVP